MTEAAARNLIDFPDGDDQEPLLPAEQAQQYQQSWQEIQASFVDQPRESVARADRLVADLMQRLAAVVLGGT
jgi:hypothetical protein